MFDSRPVPPDGGLDVQTLRGWVRALRETDRDVTDAERIDQLRVLEELKSAAAAAQARAAADLDASVRTRHASLGMAPDQQGRGVASQVALARKDSPARGGRHLGLAKALVHEMPHTLSALAEGRLSEWRATLLVRETACLSREDRGLVDREVAADPRRLEGLGDRALAAEARRLAYRLDPHAAVRRTSRAEGERRVTHRPAPDTMSNLTALLPVTQGVAAYAALMKAADEARAAGDGRSRGQVMADTLVERVTGRSSATTGPIEVHLVMTDRALFDGDDEPALVPGYGPVPAPYARALLRPDPSSATDPTTDSATDTATDAAVDAAVDAEVWVRRLFTHPGTDELVALESQARCFPKPLRGFLIARDQVCRTPWCDAPVRHGDHAETHESGGATDADNGQGMCERCNYDKQAPGWRARPSPGSRPGRHRIETVTPTGHSHVSRPPPQPRAPTEVLDPETSELGRVDVLFSQQLSRADHAA
ncbi:MAG TPA: DUF222 domain-containing protein [Actinomycetes bacterium]